MALNKKGFTLLEILLYISIAALVLYAVSLLFSTVAFSDVRNQARLEVEESAAHVLRVLIQVIRSAESVSAPALQSSGASLTLQMSDVALDPTIISLSGGTIVITEGNTAPLVLSSPAIEVTSLSFGNRSQSATSSTIHIEFEANYLNTSGRAEFEYAETFYASATTRQ